MNTEDKKKMGVVILAIAAGLIAAILTGNYIRNESAMQAKEYEQKKLMPLMQEIETLRQENRQIMAAVQQQQALPRDDARRPAARDVVMASLSEKTPAGKRAVTIQIDSLAAVGGLVNPGDRVDVLGRLSVPRMGMASKAEPVTTVIFQNVEVLAVGPKVAGAGSYEEQQKAKNLIITLALNPEEAGLLAFAQQHGQLQFFLRPPSENQTYVLNASDWQTLGDYIRERQGVDINPPPPPKADTVSEEGKPYIQIFKGGQQL